MSDKSTEFMSEYQERYGRHNNRPDYTKCAEAVYTGDVWSGSRQCSRKNGHGPHGAWCKRHNPEAVRARREAQTAKWDAERAARNRKTKFQNDCITAVRNIAAGHNDPRGLCQSIIDEANNEPD